MGILNDVQIISGQKKVPGQQNGKNVFSGKKILIVEDDQALVDVLEETLKKEGFSTEKAANGKEGLDKAQSFKPNLILLDLMMPVMSGQSMLHHLRELPEFKNLPVIVLTNAGEVDNLQFAHFKNAHFLIKSNVSLAEIVKIVRELI